MPKRRTPSPSESGAGGLLARKARLGKWLGYLGGAYFALLVIVAVTAPWIVPVLPNQQDLQNTFLPPVLLGGEWQHPLGTDDLGRDVFSRLVYGSRVSLIVGLGAVTVSAVVGTLLGMAAGYAVGTRSRLGSVLDRVVTLLSEMALAIPAVLLAIAVAAVLGTNLVVLIAILSLFGWVIFARVVRGAVLSLNSRGYVENARVLGASHAWILRRHMLPNVLGQVLVVGSLQVGFMILVESALGYLGLGVQPPTPTWGNMVAEGRLALSSSPWIALFSGFAITLTVLSVNFVGDYLRTRLSGGLSS